MAPLPHLPAPLVPAPDPDFPARLKAQLDRLASDYRVHLPGVSRGKAGMLAKALGIDVPVDIVGRITAVAERA